MGFNKRYVTKELIVNKYKQSGVKGLADIFTPKTDAYIFKDDFSYMIFELFDSNQYRKIKCLIR